MIPGTAVADRVHVTYKRLGQASECIVRESGRFLLSTESNSMSRRGPQATGTGVLVPGLSFLVEVN